MVGLRPEGAQAGASNATTSRAGTGTGQSPGGFGPGQGQQRAAARPGDTSDIVGDPIGREALMSELQSEMIPYTPEELIAIANK